MGADIIQVKYDELEALATRFGRQAKIMIRMRGQGQRAAQSLRQGGWQGASSTAFFTEMDSRVFPALQRLISALEQAQKVTVQIGFLMRQAEADAARPFQRGDGPVAPLSVPDPKVAPVHDPARDRPILGGLFTDKYYYNPTFRTFAGSISPDGISPDDIDQGSLGDCYFMAALSTVAQQHPEVIRNAIKDNGNGTYTVTFNRDGRPVQVTVDAEFPVGEDLDGNPTNTPAYAKTGSRADELWPMIMEKAYAQLQGNSYQKIDGGWPEKAVELITGRPGARLNLDASTPEQQTATLQDLQTRLDQGDYVTAATRWFKLPWEKWPANVDAGHAYAVERVDVARGLIYLRNPWDSTSNPQPMTLQEFNEYYDYMAANQ